MSRKERIQEATKKRKIRLYVMGNLFIGLLVAGWFLPLLGYFIPLCMFAGIGMASIKGRKWCNWFCPRGSFADSYLKRISPERRIPDWLRSLPVRIGVLSFLMVMLAIQIIHRWPDPHAIGRFFVLLLTITTAVGILLAFLYHQRSWCYVCPIGSLSSWVGRNRYQLRMDSEVCIECGACTKTCPMQLEPQEMSEQREMAYKGDCLKCGLCIAACPKDALTFPNGREPGPSDNKKPWPEAQGF
jgi:polyferredoxin